MTARVLLTGATGFVGRQILRELAERGASVRAVTRRPEALADAPGVERVVLTRDLFAESDGWWADACAGVDVVLHAAWYVEPGKYLTSPLNMACLRGTLALAVGAASASVRRFVGVGTFMEYDTAPGELPVTTPLRPTTPYAAAKAAAYLGLSQWLPTRGVQFAWCRLFYLYGEGEDSRRLVAHVRSRLAAGEPADLTEGQQVRDFLDVREAGRIIADVALGDREGAVNVCSGVPTTVRELVERVADEYGRRDLLRFGARAENLVDPPRVVGVP